MHILTLTTGFRRCWRLRGTAFVGFRPNVSHEVSSTSVIPVTFMTNIASAGSHGFKTAYLVNRHTGNDWALFKLDDDQRSQHWLPFESLEAMKPDHLDSLKDARAFTIGYNQDVESQQWTKHAKKFNTLLSPPQRNRINSVNRTILDTVSIHLRELPSMLR